MPGKAGHIGREGIWAIRLLALTGMRRDEVRDLLWDQVDWRQRILRLPDSKTGKRDIVVSDEVMALLGAIGQAKGHPRQGLVVCSKTGNKLHSLGETWRNGVPLQVVGKMLSISSTRHTRGHGPARCA